MIRQIIIIYLLTITIIMNSQSKNFIDLPHIEVSGHADTFVTPDMIFIKITLSEKDTKGKMSLDELEKRMVLSLQSLEIDVEKNLKISDILSNYRTHLIKKKDIILTKEYILKVKNAETASKVFILLEDLDISNTSVYKLDHSEIDNIKNLCRTKAVIDAHKKAIALTSPLSQTIGNAIFISDLDMIPMNPFEGVVAGINVQNYRPREASKVEVPKIEFEKIKVSSDVRVTFILK